MHWRKALPESTMTIFTTFARAGEAWTVRRTVAGAQACIAQGGWRVRCRQEDAHRQDIVGFEVRWHRRLRYGWLHGARIGSWRCV